MKKNYFVFILLLTLLFMSCSNLVSPSNELSRRNLQFNLGNSVASEMIENIQRSSNITGDDTVTVNCELAEEMSSKLLITSKNVLLKDLRTTTIEIKDVPCNRKFKVKISVYYNNTILYEGISSTNKIGPDDKDFLVEVPLEAKVFYDQEVSTLKAKRGNGNVVLTWTYPTDSNFAKIVVSCPENEDNFEITDNSVNSTKISLPNGKKYNITVQCVDKNGFKSKGVSVIGETWYALTEDVEVLPAGTDGSAGKNGKYVLFGDYPQTKRATDVKILPDTTEDVNNTSYSMGDDGYYYKYEVKDGSGVYYKVEPIKWRVLTENYKDGTGMPKGKLLMAENALTALDFYTKIEAGKTVNGQKAADIRKIEGKDVYGNNYKYSNIRAYLNGLNGSSYNAYDYSDPSSGFISFIDMAFTQGSKKNIVQINVDNSIASTGMSENKYVCENTNDKVFLMSYKEMTNPEYGFKSVGTEVDPARNRKVTDYSMDKAATNGVVLEDRTCEYWLRSPSAEVDKQIYIGAKENNLNQYAVTNTFGRVVPAIVVNF